MYILIKMKEEDYESLKTARSLGGTSWYQDIILDGQVLNEEIMEKDCAHCTRTYGTLNCIHNKDGKWVYNCDDGHKEFQNMQSPKLDKDNERRNKGYYVQFNELPENAFFAWGNGFTYIKIRDAQTGVPLNKQQYNSICTVNWHKCVMSHKSPCRLIKVLTDEEIEVLNSTRTEE